MTDEDTRIINRAICLVGEPIESAEDEERAEEIREAARAALHRMFRKQVKLARRVERLHKLYTAWYKAENKRLEAELTRLREALERIAADRTTNGNAGDTAAAAESWYAAVARAALEEKP